MTLPTVLGTLVAISICGLTVASDRTSSQSTTDAPPQSAAASPTITSPPTSERIASLKAKANDFKDSTLVFKSFYIGMPLEDAADLLHHYSGTPQTVRRKLPAQNSQLFKQLYPHLADIAGLAEEENSKASSGVVSDSEGKVIAIIISPALAESMFDAKGMPQKAFMQTFIDAYNVPSLEPVKSEWKSVLADGRVIVRQPVYTHRSPQGYLLQIWGEQSVLNRDAVAGSLFIGDLPVKHGIHNNGLIMVSQIPTADTLRKSFD